MTGLEQKRTGRRPGFTLVELLVVLGVVLVLMTLVVAFVPRTMEQQRVTRAASQLQGWLSLSKQWALRDRAPRGLRFTYDSTTKRVTTNYASASDPSGIHYVERPDDWRPGGSPKINNNNGAIATWVSSGGAPMKGMIFTVTSIAPPDFSGGFGGIYSVPSSWPVQDGDYLEISSGSLPQLAKIVYDPGATPPVTLTPTSITVNRSDLGAVNTSSFVVVRKPRVRTGEAPLQLPADTAIDLYPNGAGGNFSSQLPTAVNVPGTTTYYFDILFSPYGGVIADGVGGNDLHLWLVDTTLNSTPNTINTSPGAQPFDGQELIVTIGLRSGFISVQPPDTNSGDPYSYTRDGKTSGF